MMSKADILESSSHVLSSSFSLSPKQRPSCKMTVSEDMVLTDPQQIRTRDSDIRR